MEPHRYQRKDDQDKTLEIWDTKPPCRRNKDDLGRTTSRWNVEVLEKGIGKGNKQRPFMAPSNEDAKE